MPDTHKNGPCRACGACCRVISLGFDLYSPEMLKKAEKPESGELRFLQLHWQPITFAKAREEHFHRKFKESDGPWHIYTCILLDNDGRCSVQDSKPYACRGYPWYNKPPRPIFNFASLSCGFIPEYMEAQAMRQRLVDVLHRIVRHNVLHRVVGHKNQVIDRVLWTPLRGVLKKGKTFAPEHEVKP